MNEGFVTKERFDVELRRIDERIDTILGRIDDKMDAHMARVDARFACMEGRIDKLEGSIESLRNFVGWAIGLIGLMITVAPFIYQALIK